MNTHAKKQILACYIDNDSSQVIKDVAANEDRSISYLIVKEMIGPWIKKNRHRALKAQPPIAGQ